MPHDTKLYHRWLINNFIRKPGTTRERYLCLLDQLSRKEYYTIVHNDENRAEDGLYLRDEFLMNHEEPVPEGPCSFLEFLVALARQIKEMVDDGRRIPVEAYFWELANRLELTRFTDDAYGDESTVFVVDNIMTDFMDRKYCRDGGDGLFPLRRPEHNQRDVEVWYQMNAYLMENPDFFETTRV